MNAVDGVDPKDGALLDVLQVDGEPGCAVIAAAEYGGSEHLGEMMGVAGVTAGDVGDGVLTEDGLSVDGDNCPGFQAAEVGFAGDEDFLPGVGDVVVFAIMENVHCCIDFRFVDEFRGKNSAGECQNLALIY